MLEVSYNVNCMFIALILFHMYADGDKQPNCPGTNASFLNHGDEATVYLGFSDPQNHTVSINYTKCNESNCTISDTASVNGTQINVTLGSLNKFYENDVIVTTDDGDACGETYFQIPNMQKTGKHDISFFLAIVLDSSCRLQVYS